MTDIPGYHTIHGEGGEVLLYDAENILFYKLGPEGQEALRQGGVPSPSPGSSRNRRGISQDAPHAPGSRPVLERLVLIVTTECNLRCRYCYAGGGNYGMRLQPMSSAVALQTVRWAQAHFAAIGTIQFFGGEPALNSRIIRTVCEAFRESSMQVSQYGIITNGVYLLVGERPETPKPQKRWADLFGHLRALSWEIFSIPLESLHGRLDTIARWFLPFLIVSVVLSTLAVWLWGGWHWATMQEMARFSRQGYNILLMLAINGFAIPFFYLFNAGVALFILGSGLWQLNKAITSHLRPLLPALVPGWTVDIVMVGIDLICLYLLRNRLRVLLAW